METHQALAEHDPARLRPQARWVHEVDGAGRARLVMVWSVPDVDAALTGLASTDASATA